MLFGWTLAAVRNAAGWNAARCELSFLKFWRGPLPWPFSSGVIWSGVFWSDVIWSAFSLSGGFRISDKAADVARCSRKTDGGGAASWTWMPAKTRAGRARDDSSTCGQWTAQEKIHENPCCVSRYWDCIHLFLVWLCDSWFCACSILPFWYDVSLIVIGLASFTIWNKVYKNIYTTDSTILMSFQYSSFLESLDIHFSNLYTQYIAQISYLKNSFPIYLHIPFYILYKHHHRVI